MPTDNSDVIMEQYQMLRSEIVSLIEQTRRIEVMVIGALGAFYSWMDTRTGAHPYIWYLATGLGLFGGLRSLGLFVRMGDISKYMRVIENGWEIEDKNRHKGWEQHFAIPSNNCFPLSWVTSALWLIIIAGTFFAPKLFTKDVVTQNPPSQTAPAKP